MFRVLFLSLALTFAGASSTAPPPPRVVDGDTLHDGKNYLRIKGLDTPETRNYSCTREYVLGREATRFLERVIRSGQYSITDTLETDFYKRKLVYLYYRGQNYADLAIKLGLAKPYNGGKRPSWCSN